MSLNYRNYRIMIHNELCICLNHHYLSLYGRNAVFLPLFLIVYLYLLPFLEIFASYYYFSDGFKSLYSERCILLNGIISNFYKLFNEIVYTRWFDFFFYIFFYCMIL